MNMSDSAYNFYLKSSSRKHRAVGAKGLRVHLGMPFFAAGATSGAQSFSGAAKDFGKPLPLSLPVHASEVMYDAPLPAWIQRNALKIKNRSACFQRCDAATLEFLASGIGFAEVMAIKGYDDAHQG